MCRRDRGKVCFGTDFILNHSRRICRAEGDQAVKKLMALVAILILAGAAGAGPDVPQGRPLKLVLARQSTVAMVDVMKDFSDRCPNVTLTTDQKNSDYMLYAGGYSGGYRFMLIAKGGDTLYATKTVMLSNAVKDVCHFLNTRP
jgi:hypothetical protein